MKCKLCQVGTYSHSSSEDSPLYEDLEVDGMGNLFSWNLFKFCPRCGTKVDKGIIKIHKEREKKRKIAAKKQLEEFQKARLDDIRGS